MILVCKSKTTTYKTWIEMKRRCYTKTSTHYRHYGGRGISVCQEWVNSFDRFLEDMGEKPSPAHSIDRIDVNGNYCKDNCRWVLQSVNNANRRQKNKERNIMTGVYRSKYGFNSYISINKKRFFICYSKSEIYCHEKFRSVFFEWYGFFPVDCDRYIAKKGDIK